MGLKNGELPEMVRVAEAAKQVGVSTSTLSKWCKDKTVDALRVGPFWFLTPSQIDRAKQMYQKRRASDDYRAKVERVARARAIKHDTVMNGAAVIGQDLTRITRALERIADSLEEWVTRPRPATRTTDEANDTQH